MRKGRGSMDFARKVVCLVAPEIKTGRSRQLTFLWDEVA